MTRQAQSKINKVLRGSPGAMADVLRPFSELQGKKQQRAAGQAGVTITGLFSPPQSDAVTDVPASPHPQPGSSTLLCSSVRSFGGNKSKTLTSLSLADPPIQSRATVGKSGLF